MDANERNLLVQHLRNRAAFARLVARKLNERAELYCGNARRYEKEAELNLLHAGNIDDLASLIEDKNEHVERALESGELGQLPLLMDGRLRKSGTA